jgi:hypothetical protein
VIPDEIAECLTGQAIPALGIALLVLIVAGGVLLWRGGNRIAPVVCGLCLLVSAALAGPLNIRARYLLPVSPLLILMGLYGVIWAARRALAWRGRAVGPAGPWGAAALFVGIVVAINLPTVAREAFCYDLYAARTGEFYRQIEEGHYADLPALAEFLRQDLPPGRTAIVRGDRVNELHLLSGLHTVPFKKVHVWNPWSAEHADEIYADLRGRGDVGVIIHDRGGLNERFNERLSELLAGDPDLRSAGFRGRFTEVYVRRK